MSLDYVDIIPKCLEEGGIFSEAKYERFDGVMARANAWLRSRPDQRVLTCESVEMKQKDGVSVQPEKMNFFERGEQINRFVRALRLWVRERLPDEPPEPQQLGHWNVVPVNTEGQGIFSKPKFEQLGETLQRVNSLFRQNPLAGSILNVETQDMKCHTSLGTADPDECSWRESGKTGCHFVMVLRVFFVHGPPAYEEIGCADFVPRNSGRGESFGSVLGQARQWLANQHGVRFINVQSIDYKLKRDWGGETLDTHRTSYYERGEGNTYYVRIVRVVYGRPYHDDPSMMPPPMPMPSLNYRTFRPNCLSAGGFSSPVYETMSRTWYRTKAWLRAAGVTNFLSVETVPVRLYSGHQHGNHEVTYTRNNGDRNETWLLVLRVYINGPYREPAVAELPPAPDAVEDDCCVII